MVFHHAVGQRLSQTVEFSRPDGVFKARQGWLRSQIAARDRIAVEQHLVNGVGRQAGRGVGRSEEHTSELQSLTNLVFRLPPENLMAERTIGAPSTPTSRWAAGGRGQPST